MGNTQQLPITTAQGDFAPLQPNQQPRKQGHRPNLPNQHDRRRSQPSQLDHHPAQPGQHDHRRTQSNQDGRHRTQPSQLDHHPAQPGEHDHRRTQPNQDGRHRTQPSQLDHHPAQPGEHDHRRTQPNQDGRHRTHPHQDDHHLTDPEEDHRRPTQPYQQGCSPTLGRFIICAILSLILLLGIIALITWLAVNPKKLRFSIETGSFTSFNLTQDHLNSADIRMGLQATNPNHRMSVYYDKIQATTVYEDQKLALNDVRPFYQRRRNVTHVDLYLAPRDIQLYSNVARDIRAGRAAGSLDLYVNIWASIRWKIGVMKIRRHLMVFCGPITTPFSPPRSINLIPCHSYTY